MRQKHRNKHGIFQLLQSAISYSHIQYKKNIPSYTTLSLPLHHQIYINTPRTTQRTTTTTSNNIIMAPTPPESSASDPMSTISSTKSIIPQIDRTSKQLYNSLLLSKIAIPDEAKKVVSQALWAVWRLEIIQSGDDASAALLAKTTTWCTASIANLNTEVAKQGLEIEGKKWAKVEVSSRDE